MQYIKYTVSIYLYIYNITVFNAFYISRKHICFYFGYNNFKRLTFFLYYNNKLKKKE